MAAYETLRAIRDEKNNLRISCPVIVGVNLGFIRDHAGKKREKLRALRVLEDVT